MRYAYTSARRAAGTESVMPELRVNLIGPKRSLEQFMIVDSGAGMTMLPRSLAEFLGLKFDDGFVGIVGAGSQVERSGRTAVVDIAFGGDRFTSPVLVPDEGELLVLGHRNFFERYWVAFDTPRREFFLELHAQRRAR